MTTAIENRDINDLPVETRSALSRLAGGASLIAVRDGVAVFDKLVDINGQTRNLEVAMRDVQIRAGSAKEVISEVDGKKKVDRTVDVIWTTGATVLRYDWWNEEQYEESIEVSDKAIRLGRMQDGAPVLNSHYSYDLADLLGKVERVWLENGNGMATVRFSNRASIDEIWEDVTNGIITKISVGYRVHEWNIVRKEGQTTTKRAVDWEPYEISFVAIPADSGCSVRSHGNPAPDHNRKKEGTVSQPNDTTPGSGTDANRNDVVTPPVVEETRANPHAMDIVRYASVPANGIKLEDALRMIDEGKTLTDVVRSNIDKALGEGKKTQVDPTRNGGASVIAERSPKEEMTLRAEMFTAEMMDRTSIATVTPSEKAREYAGQGARGAAMAYLRSVGAHFDERATDAQIIVEALERSSGGGFTSSDFLAIYQKPAQASIDQGWKETIAETCWQDLSGNMPLPDFDGRQVFSMSLFSGIGRISEDGELPMAKMSGNSYTAKVETSGIKIMLTAQALIRDNIGMWLEGMRDLGITWNQYQEQRFLDVLENGSVQASTGRIPLFRNAEVNIGTNGDKLAPNVIAITALDEDNLEKLVLALRGQKQAKALGGTLVNVTPKWLLVSPDQERAAKKALGKGVNATKGTDTPVYEGLNLKVVDSFKPKTVYLTGGQAMKGMIKRAFLEGNGDPKVERMAMTSALRTEWESYQHSDFVGASVLGAVKGKLPN